MTMSELQECLRSLQGDEGYELFMSKKGEKFRPCAFYFPPMDYFFYLEEDCSHVTSSVKGSNIELLYDAYSHEKRLIGLKITGFSEVCDPRVLEAFKLG